MVVEMLGSQGVIMTIMPGMEGEATEEEVIITITSIDVHHHHQGLQGIHTITIEEQQILITEVTCVS